MMPVNAHLSHGYAYDRCEHYDKPGNEFQCFVCNHWFFWCDRCEDGEVSTRPDDWICLKCKEEKEGDK